MSQIDSLLEDIKTVAIFGHVRPDGDCVGATLGLYNYIAENFPHIEVQVFLEKFPDVFQCLNGVNKVKNNYQNEVFDLAFYLDVATFDRVGAEGAQCLKNAKKTCNIDHHISNPLNLCTFNFVEPEWSSACEVLFYLLNLEKISTATASCLYTGIIHDTGVFKFSSTSKQTMNVVGELIDKKVDFSRIINETYYTRTYKQTLATGHVLSKSKLALEGKIVYSFLTPEEMESLQVSPIDLSNVVDTLREVSGTEVTIFLYPINGKYKISLRSNYIVDVNLIVQHFGGGGHVRAAGGDSTLPPEEIIAQIVELVQQQLN